MKATLLVYSLAGFIGLLSLAAVCLIAWSAVHLVAWLRAKKAARLAMALDPITAIRRGSK